MQNSPAHRLAGVAVVVGLAALAAGCGGGSASKATPLAPNSVTAAPTPTTTDLQGRTTASGSTPSSSAPGTAAGAPKPSSAQLAALQQQLNDAGSAIDASGAAVSGSDVNTAKTQEGTAP